MKKQIVLRQARHQRIRTKLSGTSERPRLSIYRGNRHIYLQLIDDTTGKTILGISDASLATKGSGLERAKALAIEFSKQINDKKISHIVFDRGGFKYHGQVKMVADTLREAGITV